MGIALNISWTEINDLEWSEFSMLLEKLGDMRSEQASKYKSMG